MPMLSLATIRTLVETDLSDTALTVIANAEYEELIARYGDDAARTVFHSGGHQDIVLFTPIVTLTSVVEVTHWGDERRLTLAVDDYQLLNGGTILRRLGTGTNQTWLWSGEVEITYTPASRDNLRNRVHCDLIKLILQFNGSREEWFGDYRTKFGPSYHTSREQIMRQMAPNRGMILA